MGHGNGVVPPPTPQFPMLDGLPVGIQCLRIVNLLLELPNAAAVFGKPVDTVKYDLPTYFDVVKKPMDLGTVSKKLTQGFDDCGYYSSKPTSMEENDLHLEMLSRNVYLYFNYCTTLPTSVIDSNKIGNNWRKTTFQQMLARLVEVRDRV
ncbi:hypothetical protein THAOC_27862, partial [Thalassiosira oceanica]